MSFLLQIKSFSLSYFNTDYNIISGNTPIPSIQASSNATIKNMESSTIIMFGMKTLIIHMIPKLKREEI
jgi:hypothetical protein